MQLWPAVAAVLGFLALTAVVIALGTSSTARYEFELNGGPHHQRQPPTTPSGGGTGPADDRSPSGRVGHYRSWLRGGASVRVRKLQHRARVYPVVAPGGEGSGGRAASPVNRQATAGRPGSGRTLLRTRPKPAGPGVTRAALAVERAPAVGWWLISDAGGSADDGGVTPRVVAGPFADRVEADWAALASELPASAPARVVYGRRRDDGVLVRRTSPEERAWFAELGQQLDRLSDDWDTLLSDTDELTSLVVEVTAALVEAGLPLYDDGGRQAGGSAGGVCLTPEPGHRGILVTWRQHDRMSVHQVRGVAADAAVQQTMSAAIADVLAQLGFRVEPSVSPGCHLVTAP